MVTASTTLGNETVARVAHGLMTMTWTPQPVPDEQCFESIKAGVDALPTGTKAILNAGEFYAQDLGTANLEMLSRFYAKYPEYAEKTFLSVKGGMKAGTLSPDGSPDNLRASVDNIQRVLGSIKKVDLFEPARLDPNVPIEKQIETLAQLVKEGKFTYIGLSECSAPTLRRAHAVHPVTAVEIEISPWEYGVNQKAVIETAKELGISVFAYSPLGKGLLTGQIKSLADIPEGDMRHHLSRFKGDALQHNLAIVDAVKAVAARIGCTPGQLAIAWVAALGSHVIPLPGSSKASRTLENLGAGDLKLSDADLAEVNNVLNSHEVKGDRQFGMDEKELNLWA
ncbi:hypothetical protein NMY22_g16434 [Coprinellus aureogranulatus]|nr:hypothetical protein NMY22_g16434 [Coprinellus aureogranulatus]